MDQGLKLRIVLASPPSGVDFGLQQGSGSAYTTIQKQRSNSQDLIFELTIRVKYNNPSVPDFTGSFVQGNRNNRFIYIDIGTSAGQTDSPWTRRLKIPLQEIGDDMCRQAFANPGLVLETHVPGTGRDAGPNCGTVKPFNGWHLKSG